MTGVWGDAESGEERRRRKGELSCDLGLYFHGPLMLLGSTAFSYWTEVAAFLGRENRPPLDRIFDIRTFIKYL
jgi:hypothetical protein